MNLRPLSREDVPRQVYYTLDHRRLKCMKEAGCVKVRAHVVLRDKFLDECVNKGLHSIGMRSEIELKRIGFKRRRMS